MERRQHRKYPGERGARPDRVTDRRRSALRRHIASLARHAGDERTQDRIGTTIEKTRAKLEGVTS